VLCSTALGVSFNFFWGVLITFLYKHYAFFACCTYIDTLYMSISLSYFTPELRASFEETRHTNL
jgi:hypothetical protein